MGHVSDLADSDVALVERAFVMVVDSEVCPHCDAAGPASVSRGVCRGVEAAVDVLCAAGGNILPRDADIRGVAAVAVLILEDVAFNYARLRLVVDAARRCGGCDYTIGEAWIDPRSVVRIEFFKEKRMFRPAIDEAAIQGTVLLGVDDL